MPVITKARASYKLELAAEVLGSGGAIRLQALGTSMLPSIWPGDILRIEHKAAKEIVPGDIVLVARDGRFFVHRLIEKHNSRWITRGDSLPQNDPPVAEAQVLGRVSLIHREAGVIVPKPRLSVVGRPLTWLLCRWDWFRNLALRFHSFWCGGAFDILVAPPSRRLSWGRPRPHLRGQDALAAAGKMPALQEPR
jgi:Peptidase S24-like